MFNKTISEKTIPLADQAAATAEQAIQATQRATNDGLDGLASTVHDLRRQAAPLLNRASEQANALLQQGMDAFHGSSDKIRSRARHASTHTTRYIQDEPVKAVLIAAAVGAVLAAAVRLGSRTGK